MPEREQPPRSCHLAANHTIYTVEFDTAVVQHSGYTSREFDNAYAYCDTSKTRFVSRPAPRVRVARAQVPAREQPPPRQCVLLDVGLAVSTPPLRPVLRVTGAT